MTKSISITKIFSFEMAHQLETCYTEDNTFTCPICGKIGIKNIIKHFVKKTDEKHISFIEKFDEEIKQVIDGMAENYLQIEINKELQKHIKFLTPVILANRIRERIKELKLDWRKVMGEKRKGLNNPVHKNLLTKDKISQSIKDRWEEGCYEDRINGMLGKVKEASPRFDPTLHTIEERSQRNFSSFLKEFQDISICNNCGCVGEKINVHHIDEEHKNFLPSNLEPLCINCHMKYHQKGTKKPYVTIGKYFSFSAAHELPSHKSLCKFLHGHEWKLCVQIKKRINWETGMIMDFSDLKSIVNTYIISVLDHSYLNEIMYNPTAENLLIWIWERLMFDGLVKGIHKIELWESSTSIASVDEAGMRSVLIEKETESKS